MGPARLNWRFVIPMTLNAAAVLGVVFGAKAALTWIFEVLIRQ